MSHSYILRLLSMASTAIVLILAPGTFNPSALLIPTNALAAHACQNTTDNNHDGWEDLTNGGYGAAAWIVTRVPSFCSGTNPLGNIDHIDAWTLEGSNADDPNHNYAQAGYTISPSKSLPEIFAEFTSTSCLGNVCTELYNNGVTTSDGDNFQYITSYVTTQSKILMDISNSGSPLGTNEIASTDYNPMDKGAHSGVNYWPVPWESEYSGENQNLGDDVPGTATKKASFTSVDYSLQMTSSMPPSNLTSITSHSQFPRSESYWCIQDVAANAFNIWTTSTTC